MKEGEGKQRLLRNRALSVQNLKTESVFVITLLVRVQEKFIMHVVDSRQDA